MQANFFGVLVHSTELMQKIPILSKTGLNPGVQWVMTSTFGSLDGPRCSSLHPAASVHVVGHRVLNLLPGTTTVDLEPRHSLGVLHHHGLVHD